MADVDVGVEVQPAVAKLRKEIHARLALGHVERPTVELSETLGERLQPLRVRDEGLHLLLTRHELEPLEHSLDRRRKLMLVDGV